MMLIVSDYAFCQSISPGLVKTEFHGRLEKRIDPETKWEGISEEVSVAILVIVPLFRALQTLFYQMVFMYISACSITRWSSCTYLPVP